MAQSSKKLIAIGLALAVVIAAVSIWFATRPGRPRADDPVTRLAYFTMTSDLRGLVIAEQTTRRIRGRYVPDAEDAGHMTSPGVTPPRIILTDTGFVASVGYKTIPGIRCTVAVYTRNPVNRFAKNGEVVCE